MTLQEYYDQLASHDWYYHFSDDGRVYNAGYQEQNALKEIAKKSPEFQALYDAWHNYMFTGEPWGNERAPYPERPL